MRAIAAALALVLWLYGQHARAHDGKPEALKALPGDHRVQAVACCEGVYTVELESGASFRLREFDLRSKTDRSGKGPAAGSPVIVPAGMMGDRAFLSFARAAEISAFIKERRC